MATIAVGFAQVEECRQAVLSLCTKLEQNMNNLEELLAPIRAQWTGSASEAFAEAYTSWRTQADDLRADLTWIHSMVCNAQTNFAAADTAVMGTWQAG
jgi:6 kDa early secretory antigenic target